MRCIPMYVSMISPFLIWCWGVVAVNLHAVAAFNKITFAKDAANDSQTSAWNNAFICKFNSNIFSHDDLRNQVFFFTDSSISQTKIKSPVFSPDG